MLLVRVVQLQYYPLFLVYMSAWLLLSSNGCIYEENGHFIPHGRSTSTKYDCFLLGFVIDYSNIHKIVYNHTVTTEENVSMENALIMSVWIFIVINFSTLLKNLNAFNAYINRSDVYKKRKHTWRNRSDVYKKRKHTWRNRSALYLSDYMSL